MTNSEIVEMIKASVGEFMREDDIQDMFWAITTNPDLMMEAQRRYADWCREMNETHPEP